jgi:AcrR family transcriptional regulator
MAAIAGGLTGRLAEGADASGSTLAERPEVAIEHRVESAALRCLARRGLRRTTLDDVAREAGCSRATIYRAFPGGKDVLMAAAATHEIDRVLDQLGRQLDEAATMVDALVVAMTGATRAMYGNDALQYLWAHEPGVVQPHLSFQGLDPVLARAVEFLTPALERFVDPVVARRTAEWAARLVVLYAEPGAPFDLTEPADARRLVTVHVLPGVQLPEDSASTKQQEPKP